MSKKTKRQVLCDEKAAEITAKFNEGVAAMKKGERRAALEAWLAVPALIEGFPDHVTRDNDPWFKVVKADATYNVACMHAVLGEREQALDALEKAFGLGFKKRELLEQDGELDSIRDDPRFLAFAKAVKLRGGPLTIESVIYSEIVRKTLTEEGIDPLINAEVRSCVVYHHEWVRSPELKGLSCLMLASLPGGGAGVKLIHDIEGKTLIPAGSVDGSKLKFLGE